ncbi:MAG TPA: DUF6159 family protein [Blastocatellia bacterium]|nr:DUF6159 family protein [Blastocatellia bacterium]
MSKYSRTWALIKGSWGILKQEKRLILFPILSGLCCLLLMAPFVLRLSEDGDDEFRLTDDSSLDILIILLGGLLVYSCLHFIVTFFNAAIVAYASLRIREEDASLKEGFLAALDCIHLIAGWAIIAATVGLILTLIEDRLGRFSRLIVEALGISWAAVSFLVVPILVIERRNAVTATKESAELLKEVWGEGLLSNFYLFRVFLYLSLPGLFVFALGFMIGTNASVVICLSLSLIYFVLLMIAHATLKSIFQTALYYYARESMVAEGFRRDDLRRAFSK